MLTFVEKYKGGEFSQSGEAGIIDEILKRIKRYSGISVEFGAPTRQYCSNTYHLSLSKKWGCYWFDNNPQEEGITKMEITTANVNDLPHCHLLSMDTDGPDWELWEAYKGTPEIVVIEINSSLDPMKFAYGKDIGASYIAMLSLGIAKGYFLVAHTGNMIFVKNEFRELFPEIKGDGITNYSEYFNSSWL